MSSPPRSNRYPPVDAYATHQSPDHPQELHNLAAQPAAAAQVCQWAERLRTFVDPSAADALAKADQQQKLADFGGEADVLRRGLSNSAIPGEKPIFHTMTR